MTAHFKKVENLFDFIPAEEIARLKQVDDVVFIGEIYKKILHREPDEPGQAIHLQRLRSGVKRERLVAEILRSEESRNLLIVNQMISAEQIQGLLAQDGQDFVQAAYAMILGRTADPSGLAYHTAAIHDGRPKVQMLADLVTSEEGCQYRAPVQPSMYVPPSSIRTMIRQLKGILKGKSIALPAPDRILNSPLELRLAEDEPLPAVDDHSHAPLVGTVQVADAALFGPKREFRRRTQGAAIWMDLTTTMQWASGVVGIVRAELEVAFAMKKIYPDIRYSMQIGEGFVEIEDQYLDWLFNADNVADSYITRFNRSSNLWTSDEARPTYMQLGIQSPESESLIHPYEPDDVVFSMGWIDSRKEHFFSKIRAQIPTFRLCYLIYDVIVLAETTRQFYPDVVKTNFEKYLEWISEHCDLVLYGGETAKRDTEALLSQKGWRVPPGQAVRFGTDIVRAKADADAELVLTELGISRPFVMTVGTLEPRKNHETLYKAYLLALDEDPDNLPQLVIVGKPADRMSNLIDKIERDPKVQGRIIILQPSDNQLAVLYKECLFTLLPSLYEGWSLTLPESLGQGKFCLSCDTPPLREIGRELVEYVAPYDVRGWAESLLRFAKDHKLRDDYEKKIKANWPEMTWKNTAQSIFGALTRIIPTLPYVPQASEIWYDLTLTYLLWMGGVSGVPRAELVFAKYLRKLYPAVHFFAYDRGGLFEIEEDKLSWLFEDDDLHTSYRHFQRFWQEAEASNQNFRSPFSYPNTDVRSHPRNIKHIPDNTIVILTGIDFGLAGPPSSTHMMTRTDYLKEISRYSHNVTLSQLIYDFTPFRIPHCHLPTTVKQYKVFIEYVSNNYDHLIYGGRTAMKDGLAIQAENGWNSPPSDFIEFGSSLEGPDEPPTRTRDIKLLRDHGIDRAFVITVGTIEPRKNHEMLYKAYISLLDQGIMDLPQLIFVGKPGWLTEDFLATFHSDERIRDHILLMSPNDEFLDVLYRQCRFTLLPSMYEGWSLTLPESLSYGKFCLTADTPPLIETGRDLVEYINPYDTMKWAERILYYYNNPKAVVAWERKIKREWRSKTWEECARDLLDLTISQHIKTYLPHNRV